MAESGRRNGRESFAIRKISADKNIGNHDEINELGGMATQELQDNGTFGDAFDSIRPLQYVCDAERRIPPLRHPTGGGHCRQSRCHKRRNRSPDSTPARTLPLYLQGGTPRKDHHHKHERHVHGDGLSARRREQQGRGMVEDQTRPEQLQAATAAGRGSPHHER